jgi:heterodisulfide reductase subunit C
MDLTPRKVINLTRAGFKDDVLSCHTIWLCSSCYACVNQCPREIGITDIMYALKQRAMRDKKYPKGMPTPVLARVFYNTVSNRGRISEIRLVIAFLSRAHWTRLIGMWKIGLNLMSSKRFSLKAETMERPQELKNVLGVIGSPKEGVKK